MNKGWAGNPAKCPVHQQHARRILQEQPSAPLARLEFARAVRDTTDVGPKAAAAPPFAGRERAFAFLEAARRPAGAVRPVRWASRAGLIQKGAGHKTLDRGWRPPADAPPLWIVTQQPPACGPAIHAAHARFSLAFPALDVRAACEVVSGLRPCAEPV